MAGDWIKIRIDLNDDPNVYILSDALGLEVPTVVGHLVVFWGWMDRHTPDGKGLNLTENVIDKKIGVVGFAAALRSVGWLEGENMSLTIPNFERHNGMSAKARALEAEAKRLRRNEKSEKLAQSEGSKKSSVENVRQPSDKNIEKCPTREEKRREENNKLKVINNNKRAGELAEFDISRFLPDADDIVACESLSLDAPLEHIVAEFRVYHAETGTVTTAANWSRLLRGWVQRRVMPPAVGGCRDD